MIGESDLRPSVFVEHNDGWQFRYNIRLIPVTNGSEGIVMGKPEHYEYEYVNVARKDRSTLIDAIISKRYSISAQIGKSSLPDCAEKQVYLTFVDTCKSIIDLALSDEAV